MLFCHKHCILSYVFQRYYYYIRNGIGTEDVAAMEDSWLENVLSLVPEQLKNLSGTIEAVSDEIREDYLLSVKKAIGTVFCLADLAICNVDTKLHHIFRWYHIKILVELFPPMQI